MVFRCKECDIDFEFKDAGAFVQFHICKVHNITSQQYYDKYIAKDGEGYCLNCGKRLKFRSLTDGYNGRTCKGKCGSILDKNSKLYYDKFLKKEGDGICKVCGKLTHWLSTNNQKRKPPKYPKYADYCSNECQWEDNEQHIKREQSNLEKYGTKYPKQNKEENKRITELHDKTNLEKYGDGYYCNSEQSKETIKEKYGNHSNLFQQIIVPRLQEKYGVINVFQLDNIKNNEKVINKRRITLEIMGNWISLDLLSEFEKYKRNVLAETRKNLKTLWKEWDGFDFYNKQKLITNEEYNIINPDKHKNTNKLQPSVDHKVPILRGFLENIDYKVIGSINNLCITSRQNNSIKNTLRDKEFLEKINFGGIFES